METPNQFQFESTESIGREQMFLVYEELKKQWHTAFAQRVHEEKSKKGSQEAKDLRELLQIINNDLANPDQRVSSQDRDHQMLLLKREHFLETELRSQQFQSQQLQIESKIFLLQQLLGEGDFFDNDENTNKFILPKLQKIVFRLNNLLWQGEPLDTDPWIVQPDPTADAQDYAEATQTLIDVFLLDTENASRAVATALLASILQMHPVPHVRTTTKIAEYINVLQARLDGFVERLSKFKFDHIASTEYVFTDFINHLKLLAKSS